MGGAESSDHFYDLAAIRIRYRCFFAGLWGLQRDLVYVNGAAFGKRNEVCQNGKGFSSGLNGQMVVSPAAIDGITVVYAYCFRDAGVSFDRVESHNPYALAVHTECAVHSAVLIAAYASEGFIEFLYEGDDRLSLPRGACFCEDFGVAHFVAVPVVLVCFS